MEFCLSITVAASIPFILMSALWVFSLPYIYFSGVSVLLDSLVKQQERRLSEKESRDFIVLVESLLKSPEKPLIPAEVVKVLIEPFLVLKKGMSSSQLHLPIELLKVINRLSTKCISAI